MADQPPTSNKRLPFFSFAWGLAEATLFFLVPDLLLSFVALHSFNTAIKLAGYATFGALVGGGVMYLWGNINPLQALAVLDSVPLIDSLMVAQVGGQLQNQGLAALLLGPALGIPYKIYAVQAGALALPFFIFLCTTLPARLMRFILVCALANVMSRLLPKAWSKDARYQSLSLIWVLFYAIYALSHQ